MKKILFIIVLFTGLSTYAQVGVGTSNPDASAQLDVVSTNKGILIPRMKLTGTSDVSTIANPKESLLVYNTATAGDVVPGFYYWNSIKWVTLGGLSGNVAISSGGTGATTAPDALTNLGAQSIANITTVLGTTLDHYPSESAVTVYVDAEATRAATVESGLQNQIFTEVSRATVAEATLQTTVDLKATAIELVAETTRATAAEVALQIDLAFETTRALGVETALQSDLTDEVARATTAEATLQADVTAAVLAETIRATNAESDELSRALLAEATLQTAVTDETTRATLAETTLQADVALKAATADVTAAVFAETTRAIDAESDELSRALSAEAALITVVSDEQSRAMAVEVALQTAVTAETTRATDAEALKEDLINKTIIIDGTATNVLYPTSLAVKNYVIDAVFLERMRAEFYENQKEDKTNKTTVIDAAADDVLYPSALAVKTYVDAVPTLYSNDGALTTARTVTQNNNDLTFTTGTAKLVVDGTLKLNAAVLHNFVPTTANIYTIPDNANTIIYNGVGDSTFTFPTPSAANTGMEIKIINASASVIYPAGSINGNSTAINTQGGAVAHAFCDGTSWFIYQSAI